MLVAHEGVPITYGKMEPLTINRDGVLTVKMGSEQVLFTLAEVHELEIACSEAIVLAQKGEN